MTDPDEALAVTQANVQSYFAASLEALLGDAADQIAWEEWVASVRFASEETWFRCNAFLLAHTLGRFLARSAPGEPDAPRDDWLDAFVGAVASGDARAELVLWASAPVDNPVANDSVRFSAALWSMCTALRTSRPLDGARPGPFTEPVWLDDPDMVWSPSDERG
ncbi:hypothetical protein [Leifsonia sp. C5G2]|uniref:hypothetical protein n=1 Tax=Leifsonia sp. C5G2 TaxID=2735269 RepID=UPI00158586D3|nr:hypothetical protein [Leifsonia sp. C5G2]NUU07266.1 hypothetical protein [Leifsonia sp. C5G2]